MQRQTAGKYRADTMGINVLGYQTTIRERIEFKGIGVHSGKPVTMVLNPADAGTGIVFSVTCPRSGQTRDIPANINSVGATDLCTVLGNPASVHIATVEHLMAALRALNIDNVLVEVDSNEVPVMDGSSADYVEAIEAVGLKSLSAMRCYIRINKPVRVDMGASWGEFVPYAGTRYEIEIDFDSSAIGRQTFRADLSADVFRRDLSRARTFGFMKDVERLWAAGFALGSSLENSVVIGDDHRVINPEGLRYRDEFVRHKALDAVGDLALAGAPFIGCYRSYRGGHKLNSLVLKALLSDRSAFDFVEPSLSQPRVRHAELVAVSAPAYAAQLI
jgi:UDP-3-O-[3-hydroxymyristoyl] N-acetylglucosamine deacetylase